MKLDFLFVLQTQSSCFIHGVRESTLICACATFAHTVCKTATLRTQNKHEKASFAYSVKKNFFWPATRCSGHFSLFIVHRSTYKRSLLARIIGPKNAKNVLVWQKIHSVAPAFRYTVGKKDVWIKSEISEKDKPDPFDYEDKGYLKFGNRIFYFQFLCAEMLRDIIVICHHCHR